MQEIYNSNIKSICNNNPYFAKCIPAINEIDDVDKYVIDREGCMYFLFNDKYYRLTSYNAQKEAEQMTKNLDFNKDNLIILFGIANIECLKLLFSQINEGSRVVIFEPNLHVLKYVFLNSDISDILASNQFIIIAGNEENIDQAIKFSFSALLSSLVKNIQVISLPNYHLYNDFRYGVIKNISSTIDVYIKSLGNSLEDIFEGFRNNYMNIDAFMTTNSIDEIKGKYQGYPAIIVASGPSLDKNIHHLYKAQDKALIISCDASYRACKKNNVKPDAIASIERCEVTYKYYYKDVEFDDDLVLLGPGVLWPEVFKKFKGKKIVMSKSESGQENWWGTKFKNVKYVNQGFSCANVAFSVAKLAGCNPIILIGQDLAYTDEKIHSESTHTKYEGKNQVDQSESLWVEDIHGGKVRTGIAYNMFREWFEYGISFNQNIKVIDATEGGALIKGSTVMDLDKAIDQYCNKKIEKHMNECLEDIVIDSNTIQKKYDTILKDIDRQIIHLQNTQKKAAQHLRTLEHIAKKNFDKLTEKQLVDTVMKMQKGDKIVKYIVEKERNISDFYQQIIKQTIIFVKQIGNDLTSKNVKRNWQLQVNLMCIISESTNIIIDEYLKMKEFITNKASEYKVGTADGE